MSLDILKRQPRHKWFAATFRIAEEWYGPHDTIEQAAHEVLSSGEADVDAPVFVTQGYRLSLRGREHLGVTYEWECDTANAFEIRLKK